MSSLKKIAFLLSLFVSSAALNADPALITCEDIAPTDYYFCYGAPKAIPKIIESLADAKLESTPLKDLAELLATLNAREAVGALRKRVASSPGLAHNYDNGPVTRQDMQYAARALIALEGEAASETLVKYLGSLGEYEFTGSAWGDTVQAISKAKLKGPGPYAKKIIAVCEKKPTECEVLLPIALDLAIGADAKNLVADFAKLKVDNKEIVTSSGEATIHGKRMLLGDKALRKWFRDAMLPKVRYWKENGGGFAFPVVHPDRYLEGARDAEDMEIHAAMALGPYPEEAVASLESILYFLEHPQEYPGDTTARAKLLQWVGREASISPLEMEDKNVKNTFHNFMTAQGGRRNLAYRLVLHRLDDKQAANEILQIVGENKTNAASSFSWHACAAALNAGLAVPGSAIRTLISHELAGEGDGKATESILEFVDTAARHMKSADWSLLILTSNVYVRDRVLFHLSRKRPQAYCDLAEKELVRIGNKINHPEVYDATFAMTIFGSSCTANLERLARGSGQTQDIARKAKAALAR